MIRRRCAPRPDFSAKLAAEGMLWATDPDDGTPYWRDDAYYEFTTAEIDRLETATEELWSMCVPAARWMLGHLDDARLGLPPDSTRRMLASLEDGDLGLHARFDLCLAPDGTPKMLEINGDTPTMLVESAVSQWTWHEQTHPHLDQWNSIHERLVAAWQARVSGGADEIHFAGILDLVEEASTLAYLADTASQGGATTSLFDLRDIGLNIDTRHLVDGESRPLRTCYKLYPWEDMLDEPFGAYVESSGVRWIEPLWRSALSTKAILAALWACYPGHPNLLPAYLDSPRDLTQWVAKPLFGREGTGIVVNAASRRAPAPSSRTSAEPVCFQQWCPLPDHDGNRPVIGAWVVDGHAAGMGIRESDGPITDEDARFVPHVIDTPTPDAATRAAWLAEDGVEA